MSHHHLPALLVACSLGFPTCAYAYTIYTDPIDGDYQLSASGSYYNVTYDHSGNKIDKIFIPNEHGEAQVGRTLVSEYHGPVESRADTKYGFIQFESDALVSVDGIKPKFSAEFFMQPTPGTTYEESAFWGSFDINAEVLTELRDKVTLVSPGQSGFGTLLLGFESSGSLTVKTDQYSRRDSHFWQVGEINASALFLAESGYGPAQIAFDDDVRGSVYDPVGSEGYIPPTNTFFGNTTTDSLFLVSLPFEYGVPFDLQFKLLLQSRILIENLDVANSFNVGSSGSFGNTVELVSASVLDASGNPDAGVSATSALGVDYFDAGNTGSPVPAAPPLTLLLAGLPALFCYARQARHHGRKTSSGYRLAIVGASQPGLSMSSLNGLSRQPNRLITANDTSGRSSR
jgi:hypothetical protein